ncbi:MAG: DJ-1/PfpI family protein [bacterium]
MMEGRKALFIIAHKDFRDEEFTHPKTVLEKQGVKVTVASSSLEKASGMLGMAVQPDILLPEVRVDDYDLVVFVGGSGSDEYWEDATAHRIAETALQKGKIVAAICIAPVTLAKAGLLKGRKATVFSSCIDHLKEKGAIYTAQPVVQDGRIITASGPDAANSFGQRLLEALKDQ